jgi:hypothetical protein
MKRRIWFAKFSFLLLPVIIVRAGVELAQHRQWFPLVLLAGLVTVVSPSRFSTRQPAAQVSTPQTATSPASDSVLTSPKP